MSTPSASLSLDEYLLMLAQSGAPGLSRDDFLDLTGRLRIDPALIERNVAFSTETYARNFVCRTPQFELLVLCWEPGQLTTVHDHRGSLNFIRVHRGTLTSRLFRPKPDGRGLDVAAEEELTPPAFTGVDRPEIHQLSNLSGERLVTMHVYAPALKELQVYDVETGSARRHPLRYTVADDLV